MNLQQELAQLAKSAPPPAEVDHLIRLARRTKTRRVIAVPLAVVLVTLVAFLPNWSRPHSEPLLPPEGTHSFLLLSAVAPIANLQTLSATLRSRAIALGLKDPHVTVISSRKVELSVTGRVDEALLRAVATQQWFHVRKVLDLVTEGSSGPPGSAPATSLDAVIAKLGDAYEVAGMIQDPHKIDAATTAKLAGFGQLSGAEVESLSAEIQFKVPTVSCAQLLARPGFQGGPLEQPVTTCTGKTKVLLDVAKLTGDDVLSAQALFDTSSGNNIIMVEFNPAGSAHLTELTREAYNNSGVTKCEQDARGDQGRCLVALSVGAHVLSTQEIQGVLTSGAELHGGNFTGEQATALAQMISGADTTPPLTVDRFEVR